jgi:hypothetical protein
MNQSKNILTLAAVAAVALAVGTARDAGRRLLHAFGIK